MIVDGQHPAAIAQAAQALAEGKLLGLPTETVYGLAANADDEQAVAQIFAAKGRPSNHPLIVHIAHHRVEQAVAHYAQAVPLFAQQLMDAFWPGALTLILPRRPHAAVASTGGQDSVGLRCPAHPVAQALLEACQQLQPPYAPIWGLSAPSANQFGRISPTTAAHVAGEFGADLLVLDGGACQVGIESTIIDCTRDVPVLLRPGSISRSAIEQACGLAPLDKEALATPAPRASGTLLAHYAPNAKLRLMAASQLQAAVEMLGAEAKNIAIYHRSPLRTATNGLILRPMPSDAHQAARQLFSDLRAMDALGVALIWVEAPPNAPEWEGVRDRLQRAAAAG